MKTKNVDEFVETVYNISGSFGGINLEDIAAPRCFEIERKLKEKCDIPSSMTISTAPLSSPLAGLTNALKVVGKKKEDVKVVTSGAGRGGDFDREAASFRRLPECHNVRSKGRYLCRPRRPQLDQRRDGGGHEPEKKAGPLSEQLKGR